MSEKFSTVTVGGVDYQVEVPPLIDWLKMEDADHCRSLFDKYTRNPDHTIIHEGCANVHKCPICSRLFGDRHGRR